MIVKHEASRDATARTGRRKDVWTEARSQRKTLERGIFGFSRDNEHESESLTFNSGGYRRRIGPDLKDKVHVVLDPVIRFAVEVGGVNLPCVLFST